MSRITTGMKGLDNLINGGFPENTSILLSGGPGSGKTLIALNFLMEGAKKGEKCCYVSLSEDQDDLLRAGKNIKNLEDMDKYVGKNLAIEKITLGENLTLRRFVNILNSYPKTSRIVIDNVNKLLLFSSDRKSYRMHLSDLIKYMKDKHKCALIICETEKDMIDSGNDEAFETDGVMHISFLDFEEIPKRTIVLHKMRYTPFHPKVHHELKINEKGINLSEIRIV